MSRCYFHVEEDLVRNELLLLKKLVNEQELCDSPCPLASCQLVELGVLLTLLQKRVSALSKCVRVALKEI